MIPSALVEQLQQGMGDFLRTSFWTNSPGFETLLEDLLQQPGALFQGPYLSLKLPFLRGTRGPDYFPDVPLRFPPHLHQEHAFRRLGGRQRLNTLVATGTGSGKTECFLVPILASCLRDAGIPGIKAILLYPMNALATDQALRLARLIHQNEKLRGTVTAGLYVGQKEKTPRTTMGPDHIITDRATLQARPPDILLTNYKMLDYLLVRPRDRKLWHENKDDTLRFLVVDEIHTFDGAQGTDLACLIRRLKSRLMTPPGHLCCVGTSATLGSPDAAANLAAYAGQVFGEPFEPDSVVGEARMSDGDFLSGSLPRYYETPGRDPEPVPVQGTPDSPAASLGAEEAAEQRFLELQYQQWFGEPFAQLETQEAGQPVPWRIALGQRLKEHVFLKQLLVLLEGKVRSVDWLVERLQALVPALRHRTGADLRRLLSSFTALVSAARSWVPETSIERARREATGQPRLQIPFLQVQVQLWQRELRRMVATVEPKPRLRFFDDLNHEQRLQHLPLVHCRDCGAMGWATMTSKDREDDLRVDLKSFYAAYFRKDPRVQFLFPAAVVPDAPRFRVRSEDLQRLGGFVRTTQSRPGSQTEAGPRTGAAAETGTGAEAWTGTGAEAGMHTAATTASEMTTRPSAEAEPAIEAAFPPCRTREEKPRLDRDCPRCDAADALTLLGYRATTLASAFIDQLFASPLNRDKKLLTFSDSVQDAAHRAGFFAARTWHFNLRVALQQVVQSLTEDPTLEQLPDLFTGFWRQRLGGPRFVGQFIPPNLTWVEEYEALVQTGQVAPEGRLMNDVQRRLAWEIASEYGLRLRIGRTLTRTGASVAYARDDLLEAAVDRMLEPLRNELGGLRDLQRPPLRAWVAGLLRHLQERGAIVLPDLPDEYFQSGGSKTFLMSRQRHLPDFGPSSRLPGFLTNRTRTRRFETIAGKGTSRWYRRWHDLLLAQQDLLAPENLESVYRLVLGALTEAGLLECRTTGKDQLWGLRPSALQVSARVLRVRCDRCLGLLGIAAHQQDLWLDSPCLAPGCAGHYRPQPAPPRPDYFGQLYRTGDLERIVAEEHTGLLERDRRQEIEDRFKAAEHQPWDPNLLSCTPTLEMGIDIGDLSSALLCSVPPAQANYLQRIGRAGRRDGNSLLLTVAGSRPHDLYFFSEPLEMIAGQIDSPGVFLNASAVLERQLTAFAFDRWIATGIDEDAFPSKLSKVLARLDASNDRAQFPWNFLDHVESHQTELHQDFTDLFAGQMTPDSSSHLRAFLEGDDAKQGSLRWKILDGLLQQRAQRENHEQNRRRLREKRRAKKDETVRDQNHEAELGDLDRELAALTELIRTLNDRDTLNFFTDEGLIPNYAFPEAGVTLRSVLWRKRDKPAAGQEPYESWSYEYERPARNALAELAPDNHFYASGRQVRISRVDLALSAIEPWRLCDQCGHADQLPAADQHKACPACASPYWSDAGQRRDLLRLRQVYARTPDHKSRIRDESEERSPTFYNRQMLVSLAGETTQDGWVLDREDVPFGFEYVQHAQFREINFGEHTDLGGTGEKFSVAGRESVRPGFTLCKVCGQVQDRHEKTPQHDLSCTARDKLTRANLVDCLYLYRSFSSEAIRMLLPFLDDADVDRKRTSFIAALQLGLKSYFGGRIDHLQMTDYSEPVPNQPSRKQFLMLYDTVPGGTGYLKELARDGQKLFLVLRRALDVLLACPCNQEPGKDGCYRCLFAYRNSYDMAETSRHTATALLRSILAHEGALKPVDSLRAVNVNALFDSVLEARFLESLRQALGPGTTLRREVVASKPGYRLKLGGETWLIEPQARFGPEHGLPLKVEVDFLLHPARADGKTRPIAIFTDGWQHHEDRIGLDLYQRMALARGGRVWTWSLTWTDVERALKQNSVPESASLLDAGPTRPLLLKLLQGWGLPGFQNRLELDNHALLVRYLADPADTEPVAGLPQAPTQREDRWRLFAFAQGVVPLLDPKREAAQDREVPSRLTELADANLADVLLEDQHAALASALETPAEDRWLRVFALAPRPAVQGRKTEGLSLLVWLDDAPEHRQDPRFRPVWNAYLKLWNRLQFLPRVFFVTRTWQDRLSFADLLGVVRQAGVAPPDPAAQVWHEAAELLLEDRHKTLLEALRQAGYPLPGIGFELPDEKGRPIATAEIAWEAQKVALLLPNETPAAPLFHQQGWTTHALDALQDTVPGWTPTEDAP